MGETPMPRKDVQPYVLGFRDCGVVRCLLFARLWRRTEVLTDAEYVTLRYSGTEAHVLRAFRAVFMGLLFNTVMLGSQFLVSGLIGTTVLGIAETDPHYTAWRIGIPILCAF